MNTTDSILPSQKVSNDKLDNEHNKSIDTVHEGNIDTSDLMAVGTKYFEMHENFMLDQIKNEEMSEK